MPFFVYIVENPSGKFYVGQTEDLGRRVKQHNDPAHNQAKYTTKHAGPWTL
ncbi:MAG: GIY-YIG nuclease family protein [Planctomycetes bacterium]|nr:GIY-YIG nuclease family protein [Planctomycetota bacterium]